ncbi:MAG TPA: bifunctional diaminohydroxyphosphoribosylaminopyrimidine deaminase/5-amino-6-(5-phosphoribosylamino)uracil reductase RibD, partial [Terriglobia bacterium]|nr:bifunctional diaminohydroxyphosphoribosylaminopyrimidine deaminase/5-amino-6-(5-phosphoribosylamino)uracil reductase RibD [Terriglobia bacterium]
KAGSRARGATLYITLEPCCHFGRTPPCTDAILGAGIRRVVYALRDPNSVVAGKGARILKNKGIEVLAGVCAAEAAALNEVYLKFRATGLPFVTAKVAATLDGKIATRTGDSKWITDSIARRRARELRSRHQAILVGINTILADDPHLGPRMEGASEPWRVVLDSRLRIPLDAKVLKTGRCIIATTASGQSPKARQLQHAGALVWRFRGNRVPLRTLLRRLAQDGIFSVLVEGGSEVLGSFYDHWLIDRMCWFLSPIVVGSRQSLPAVAGKGIARLGDAPRLRHVQVQPAGSGWVLWGNLSRWARSAGAP